MFRLVRRINISMSLVLICLLMAAAATTHAANIEVNDDCTLSDAILAANADEAVGDCGKGSGDDKLILKL